MPVRAALLLLTFTTLLAPAVAQATVAVTFVDPVHFRDAAFDREHETDPAVLEGIEQHLRKLGERYLGPGDKLDIQVLDIDLAGRLEPWHVITNPGLRFMRDITWPQVRLRYVLERPGEATTSKEETVSDPNYLAQAPHYFSSDRLRYEKQMLDEWFHLRFAAPR